MVWYVSMFTFSKHFRSSILRIIRQRWMKSNKNTDKDWEGMDIQANRWFCRLSSSFRNTIGLIFLVTLAHKINRSIPIRVCVCVCVCVHMHVHARAHSVVQSHLTLCGLMECNPDRILCPWNFPGKNSGVGCHFLLRGSSRPPSPAYFSSVTQLCLTLCDPMDCMLGFPVHHKLLKLAQTHIHQVSDAIEPSHPLSSPSCTFNLAQHQGLFQWVSSLHWVAKVLEIQLQHQSFQWTLRTDLI